MTTKWFGACAALSTVVFGTAFGQQKGQYVLGTNGLNAGIMPPPGFSYGNQSTVYGASRLRGPDGVVVPVAGSFDMVINQNFFVYTSKFKLLGGTFGSVFDLIIANASLTAPVIGVTSGGAGPADIYVQPFTLGYHFNRADLTVAFGFIAPTGRFTPDPAATGNIGSGYWGYLPSVASTILYLLRTKKPRCPCIPVTSFTARSVTPIFRPASCKLRESGFGTVTPFRNEMICVRSRRLRHGNLNE